ncbi:maleylpyruvate isomerase N-terminal domain-containing protein [Saccharopolyspora sp. K220]|uniref:maleylpyruvate isomerase N-terminal domain-containing protein n=1 Tax=Saccharopolyspora soli TaxID=2926618 RepID=UPI001F55BF49|nr:maleylpyruvate isomerase N-terminal domain-containing protein [Saccharopolyspora soli]MCI2416164.1 maleylpyruvate isomerase N-terminal domain-containing protein [Saccharopolyspora soli]
MIIDALDQAWRAWGELGSELGPAQWQRSTRLTSWTVKDVYAHYSGFPAATAAGIEVPEPPRPVTHTDAAELLAFMQRPGGVADEVADHLRDQAIEQAAAVPTSQLVEQFTEVAPQVVATLRTADLHRRVDYGGVAVVSAAEALRIFTLEAVVHYFDMATALDRPVPGPMAGAPLRETVRLLADTADPIAFIDAATGRSSPQVFPIMR